MSCRETKLSSAVFSLARAEYPISEQEMQEEFHALKRSAAAEGLGEEPTPEDVAAYVDRLGLWVRQGRKLNWAQKSSLAERLDVARTEPLPDRATWYAMRHLQTAVMMATDIISLESEARWVGRLGPSLENRHASLDEHLWSLKQRRPDWLFPEERKAEAVARVVASQEALDAVVQQARAQVALARAAFTGDPAKEAQDPDGSTYEDRVQYFVDEAREVEELIDADKWQNALARKLDEGDAATIRRVYRTQRHLKAASRIVDDFLYPEIPDEDEGDEG